MKHWEWGVVFGNTLLAAMSLPPWLLVAAFTPLMFTSNAALTNPATVIFFRLIMAYPIVVAVSLPLAWFQLNRGRRRTAVVLSMSWLAHIGAIVVHCVLWQIFQGGRLAG